MTNNTDYDENEEIDFDLDAAAQGDIDLEELPEDDAPEEKKKYDRAENRNPNAVDYVSKEELYQAYKDWYVDCAKAKEEGRERPDPPRYISESIIKICTRIASRYNFANYPFRDEMVGDAIENIFRYIDRFDVEKSKNPFGYFSIIAYYAMVRRIKYEKIRAAVKYHVLINSGVLDTLQTQEHDDGEEYQNMLQMYQSQANDSLADLIKPVKKKKVARKKKNVVDVENLLGGDDE